MYEDYGDFSNLSLDDDEIHLLLKVIDHYFWFHHDRLSSVQQEILSSLYDRLYKKLGGKNGR